MPIIIHLATLILLFANGAYAGESELCLMGCPVGTPETNRVVDHGALRLSNNAETKFADWVAYVVSRETLGPSRPRNWARDPELPEAETLSPEDYEGANAVLHVDRGHQAALASLAGTTGWRATNYLSNITPQKSELNQGAWERLEAAERNLARQGIKVHVVTGPLHERPMPPLPQAQRAHRVPSGYWKVIAVQGAGAEIDAAGFIMEQETPRDADYCAGQVPIIDIERRTGVKLFPEREPFGHDILAGTFPGALAPKLGCGK